MQILLFLATNVAVLLVVSIVFSVLGLDGILQQNGVDLDLTALLIMSAVIGVSGSLISLVISKWSAKRSMGVQLIEQPANSTERWLVDTVARQAQQAGIGMPEVGIFDSSQPNAFATGMSRNNALVAVSSGLLQQMNQDEVEAVLAHEVSHVKNGDRTIFKTERGHGPGFFITSLVAQLVLGVLASAIVMWFSRWREFRADAGSAELSGRTKMIAALRRLQSVHEPRDLPDEFAAFGIAGGFGGGIKKLFLSHPPLEDRIAALETMR